VTAQDHHDDLLAASAAYVLGALAPVDRAHFERHLSGCPTCQREVARLAVVPRFLDTIERPDDEAEQAEAISLLDLTEARRVGRRLDAARRGWRTVAIGSSAALIALLVAATVRIWPSGDGPERTLSGTSASVRASLSVDARTWGSALQLDVRGLPSRESYRLWVVGPDGQRRQAAAWGATPDGSSHVPGATVLSPAQLRAAFVTGRDPARVLVRMDG